MASELDDFRAFLEQRILAADPAADVSPGSPNDIEVITPTVNRLAPDPFDTPIQEFMRSRLRSELPSVVIQKGEPIDDYAVKAMRVMVEPFRRSVEGVNRNQSLKDPRVLNDREADFLAANYFERRRLGGFSVGIGRIFFSAPRFALVSPTNALFDGSGHRFFPVENQAISAENMLFQTDGSLFFFDVVIRAEEEGEEYNIGPNELVGIENFPSVVKVSNPGALEEGANRETTIEFLERVENALTEKSLVTLRGIRSRITDLFENVRSVSVIGYGDPEMERDVITGSPDAAYAAARLTATTAASALFLVGANAVINDGVPTNTNFLTVGVAVDDTVDYIDFSTGGQSSFSVVEVISLLEVRVDPAPPDLLSGSEGFFIFRSKNRGSIFLSGIPGGIVQPQTAAGEIIVENNEVHIGGTLDVFVRSGFPQERFINLVAIRDAEPLHYGLDLETFGANADEFVQVTPSISAGAATEQSYVGPGDTEAEILVRQFDAGDGTTPWRPTAEDVGRYIEFLGPGTYGMYEILDILGEEDIYGERAVRIQITTTDENTGTDTVTITDSSPNFTHSIRLVAKVPVASRVRDRDSGPSGDPATFPAADFNGDRDGLGARVGDSIVVETSTDAGIYTIRRILDHITEDDTLVLDRDLTTTVTPSGVGDGSGLRYRLADSLEVNLVDPRVIKIPMGTQFLGEDLQTVADSKTVFAGSNSNFILAGVEVDDTLEILEGNNQGEYRVIDVQGTQLDISPNPPNTGFNLDFTIYRAFDGIERPLVRVKEIELLDSANQPTGIKVPYGDIIDARVKSGFSNRGEGVLVESFQGVTQASNVFEDLTTNFDAKNIAIGMKLEILEDDSAGEYEVSEVYPTGGLTVNQLQLTLAVDGGRDFVGTENQLHYRLGQPSVGVARLYFLEPTSVEIDTGILGGRIKFEEDGQDKEFRFSRIDGRTILPAPASGDDDPRDIRVVRSYSVGGGQFETILEITDSGNPDAFELELEEGDVLKVQEQIQFIEDSAGDTFPEHGVFGTAAGLRTITGSNRVFIPSSSQVDFTQMGDLAGQTLYINTGPDAGRYTIERVVNAKTLELSSVMTASTEQVRGLQLADATDATLTDIAGDGWLTDTTDFGQLGQVGEYVTIFEAVNPAIEGVFRIADRDTGAQRVKLDGFPIAELPAIADTFRWVVTDSQSISGTIEQKYVVYNTIPIEVEITQVATRAPQVLGFGKANTLAGAPIRVLQGSAGEFSTVVQGDRLEILFGTNVGVYPIESATGTDITVYTAHPFSTIEVNAPYRVWAGVHGPRRMVTVGNFEGSSGLVAPGESLPYRIIRPGEFRVSSTELEENEEDGLFFVDLDVESMGPGDDRNLEASQRLKVSSGLRVDGYVYQTENRVLSYSVFEEVALSFDRRFLPIGNSDLPENRTEINGRNLQVRYETSNTVRLISDLLRSDAERPNNASPLARHFLPSFVFTNISYSGGSSVAVVGPDVEDFINNLNSLDELEVSDIETFISRRGATSIRHPINLIAVTHDLGRKLVVERSVNVIGGLTVPFDGSARISSFFAQLDEGLTIEQT